MVETLRGCTHQAFPVTPDTDKAFESAEPFDLHGEHMAYILTHQLLSQLLHAHAMSVEPLSVSHGCGSQTLALLCQHLHDVR